MKPVRIFVAHLLTLVVGAMLPASIVLGQKNLTVDSTELLMAVPIPIVVGGNPTCATLNASNAPAYSHISQDWGLKLNRDGETPFTGTFSFVNGNDIELQGGAGPSPGSYITVNVDGNTVDWTSNRLLTAVIVKGGNQGASVYPYNPPSFGGFPNGDGTGLRTPNQNNISHLVFCFESLEPSAAPASVGGRVVDAFGRGIRGARVTLTDAQNSTTWTAITSSFGYYVVDGAEVGGFYMLSVSDKRYNFENGTQMFTLRDDLTEVDFVASP